MKNAVIQGGLLFLLLSSPAPTPCQAQTSIHAHPSWQTLAFRPGFFRGPMPGTGGSNITPPFVDLEVEAKKGIDDQYFKHKYESRHEIQACLESVAQSDYDWPAQAIIRITLDRTGVAKAATLRLEGAYHPPLQSCLWREISTWRFIKLPEIDYETRVSLPIEPPDSTDQAIPLPDKKEAGPITLHTPPDSIPAPWHETAQDWVEDLSPCFEVAWQLESYQCEGPLSLDIHFSDRGEALGVENMRWMPLDEKIEATNTVLETGERSAENSTQAPKLQKDLDGNSDLEAAAEDSASTLPNALEPRCPTEVAACLSNTLMIWQLPPAPAQVFEMRLMIHPDSSRDMQLPDAWFSGEAR